MNSNDELDRILDQALTEYRDGEPLAGMEDRILRRIAAQPEPSPRRWAWILAAGTASVAVIVAVLWLGYRERPQRRPVATKVTQPAQRATTSAHIETPTSSSGQSNLLAKAHKTSRRPSSLNTPQVAIAKPALKQFPVPAPLTIEEHALLALARTHPDALLGRPDDADKLSIAPIEIKPLASEAGAPQGEQ